MNDRLTVDDTIVSAITKIAENNIGAATALIETCKVCATIDPQAAFGPYAPLMTLDVLRVYGPGVWVLWKDICGQSARRFIMLLRAYQLGFIAGYRLQELASSRDNGTTLSEGELVELDRQVCEALEQFQKPEVTT